MNIIRKIADVLAVIFHPAFVGCFILLFFSLQEKTSVNTHIITALEIVGLNLVVPIAATYILYKDLHLPKRENRNIPLIISFLSQLLLVILLRKYFTAGPLILCAWLLALNLGVLMVSNFIIKASMHANAISVVLCLFVLFYQIGAVFGQVPGIFYVAFILFLIISAIILWQRKISNAHTLAELITGFLTGLISFGLTLFYIGHFGY